MLTFTETAGAQECTPAPEGIFAWWGADEVFSCSGLGASARELTGSVRTMTFNNGASYAGVGRVGPCFELDGIDDSLVTAGTLYEGGAFTGLPIFTTAGSIELWLRATDPQLDVDETVTQIVDNGHGVDGFRNWGIFVSHATGQIHWFFGDGVGWQFASSSGVNVFDGDFHHVVATYDASLSTQQQKLYVDGVLVGSNTLTPGTPIATSYAPILFGARLGSPFLTRFFRGLIDEPTLYQRALTESEVQAIYAAGSAGKCRGRGYSRVQNLTLAAWGVTANAGFGRAVAADGDRLIVGAPVWAYTNPQGSNYYGGVLFYRFDGTSWVQDEVFSPQTMLMHELGMSVDVRGNRAIAGASQTPPWGKAAIFELTASGWEVDQLVESPGGLSVFGHSSAIDGDLAAVGAPLERAASNQFRGAVFVYQRDSSGTWSEEAHLVPADTGDRRFGWALDLDGDRLIVGDPLADDFGSDAGAVSVYERDPGTGTWSLVTTLCPTEAGLDGSFASDHFGISVSLRGDTALVGTPRDDEAPGNDAGAAYVFRRTAAGQWHEEAKLQATDAWTADGFGGPYIDFQTQQWVSHPVALSDDGTFAVVGSLYDDDVPCFPSPWDSGSVYLFRRETRDGQPAWIEAAKFRNLGSQPYAWLGISVALASGRVIAGTGVDRAEVFDLTPFTLNRPPLALVGADQDVDEGDLVGLDGALSFDPDGDPLAFAWTQIGGPSVAFDATSGAPSFVAPQVLSGTTTLSFQLVVSDGQASSEPAFTDVRVHNVNAAPVADTGLDQVLSEGSPVTLDGSGSFDVDGDALGFAWSQLTGTGVLLSDPSVDRPTFTAPLVGPAGEVLTFELTVSDGQLTGTAQTTVTVLNVNQPPLADAGLDQTSDELGSVQLHGEGSSDPDANVLTYQWTQLYGPPVTLADPYAAAPAFVAPEVATGSLELGFELTVCDPFGACASDTVAVSVQDVNAPPDCWLAQPSVAWLWPPSHELVPVGIAGVADPDGTGVTITVTAVYQDEPVLGLGSGDTGPDAVLLGDTVLLRAERFGGGNGRAYRVEFTADDGQGGLCSGHVTVLVPNNKKSAQDVVDGGPLFDSTSAN